LVVAGTIAAALTYAQNDLLSLLTQSLAVGKAAGSAEPPARPEGGVPGNLSHLAAALRIGLPLLLLGLFIVVRLASSAVEFWKGHATGKLTIRSKDDLETEILSHLLRKDDAFFSRHSPAETVNRLAVDLYRVTQRRPNLTGLWWSALLLAGNIVYFLSKDWRLALVAVAACLAGALWTLRTTRPVKEMDASYLAQDDRIKARFEDFLRAAPEVQVGHLYGKIRHQFMGLLGDRSATYLRYVRLSGALRVGNTVSYLLAFVVMLLVVSYMRSTGAVSSALALVPVVVWALPSLFGNASELVFIRLQFQIARSSMDRLLEYEAQGADEDVAPPPPVAERRAEPIRLEEATYRYPSPGGAPQGGVADVTTTFAPGHWTAIVGGAGSGKSTLLQLLLGRLRPQEGSILYGGEPLDSLSGSRRAALLSLMPQSPALLNATIRQNLLFGRPPAPGGSAPPELSEVDLDVVERAGLGRVCRLKALDMSPAEPSDHVAVTRRIVELRARLRARLRDDCGAALLPFEDGHGDPKHWILECLLAGRCDRERTLGLLLGKAAARRLRALPETTLGAPLIAFGQSLLRESRRLLSLPSFHVYSQLAPFPLDERLWRLRTSSLDLAERTSLSPEEALALCLVALTSSLAELPGEAAATEWRQPTIRERYAAGMGLLKASLGDAWRPFAPTELHPHLTWRENLVFAVVDVRNSRSGRLADQAILDFIEEEGLKATFARLGLEFEVGRLGGNLSGGQGQLVALCRALLRGTPVLVLDEPTSALDPASRSAIAALLRDWKADRIVITVSHDVEFIREADEIKLMDSGRLVASGTFKELEEGSEVFRRTLRQA
jgi:ABC-type multidrug transport system fused ATPase/permease subunit